MTPAERAANRPMSRAIRHARRLVNLERLPFVDALCAVGCPDVSLSKLQKWEDGSTIVHAYVLVGAAQVAGVPIDELLTGVSFESHAFFADQMAEIRRLVVPQEGGDDRPLPVQLEEMRVLYVRLLEAINADRAERELPPVEFAAG